MWDFLIAAFEWGQKSFGKQLINRVVAVVLIFVAGWWGSNLKVAVVEFQNQLRVVQSVQVENAKELTVINRKVDVLTAAVLGKKYHYSDEVGRTSGKIAEGVLVDASN